MLISVTNSGRRPMLKGIAERPEERDRERTKRRVCKVCQWTANLTPVPPPAAAERPAIAGERENSFEESSLDEEMANFVAFSYDCSEYSSAASQ
jgi:hypothetical protein